MIVTKEHPITKRMQHVAKDVRVLWNPIIDRWQVMQRRDGGIMLYSGKMNDRHKLMWTIEKEDGAYRDPTEADMLKLIQTVQLSHDVWRNSDKIADQMDQHTIAQEGRISDQNSAMIREVASLAGDALMGRTLIR
jgi:hypothetical protein